MSPSFLKGQLNRVSRAMSPHLINLFVHTTLARRLKIDSYLRALNPTLIGAEKQVLSRIQKLPPSFEIDKDLGFNRISLDPALVAACVNDAKEHFRHSNHLKQKNTKEYLRVLSNLSNYESSSAAFELATSENLIKPIANYLGSAPVLWTISVLHSPPQPVEPGHGPRQWKGSQFWHRDGEDVTNVKVWILCSDVDANNGPTFCVPRKLSDELAKKIGYREGEKVKQDEILEPFSDEFFSLTGEAGTTFVTDTCRCFHMGSRTMDQRGRLVLMFDYVTRRSEKFWPIVSTLSERRINANIGNLNQLQKDLLYPFFD
jgi:hypothetical protein